MRHLPLLALLLAPFVSPAAEKKVSDYNIGDFSWGKIVSGPPLSEGKLKGKGFVLCAWVAERAMNPGPALSYLQKAAVEYKDSVVFAAVEVSQFEKTNKEITALAKSAGATFTLLSGLKRNPFGDVRVVPTVYVFGQDGKMLYYGALDDTGFANALKKASLPVPKDDGKPGEVTLPKPKLDPKKVG
jgi:hypothetical protein